MPPFPKNPPYRDNCRAQAWSAIRTVRPTTLLRRREKLRRAQPWCGCPYTATVFMQKLSINRL